MTSTATDSPLGFSLQFFTDSTCAGVPVTLSFRDGALLNNYSIPHVFTPFSNDFSYFFFRPAAIHDVRIPNSAASNLSLIGQSVNSNNYINTLTTTYNITAHPEAATEMCLTETGSCISSDWVPVASSGIYNFTAGNGIKTVKLFHRNANGIVSSTYAQSVMNVALASLILSSPSESVQAGYINLSWSLASTFGNDLILSSRLKVCDTAACGLFILIN